MRAGLLMKSRSLTEGALSASGTQLITSLEFDIHLVRRNPPLDSSSRSSPTKRIASGLWGLTSDNRRRRNFV